MGRLQELITDIEESLTAEGWTLSLDAALLHLEEGPEVFYRYYYASGRSTSDLPEQFNEDNVDILLEFVEDRGLKDARRIFRKKGWYVAAEDLLLWEEFFFSVSLSALASHVIDEEDLEIALSGCLDPGDGLRFYCECRFALSDLIDRALRLYRTGGHIPEQVVPRLKRHTIEQFRRRLLREEMLYSGLMNRLREAARGRGWYREEISIPAHLQEDLALFGIRETGNGGEVSEDKLKERYRHLLKKVHPDVNPSADAVAQTQRINEAYARISVHMAGRT